MSALLARMATAAFLGCLNSSWWPAPPLSRAAPLDTASEAGAAFGTGTAARAVFTELGPGTLLPSQVEASQVKLPTLLPPSLRTDRCLAHLPVLTWQARFVPSDMRATVYNIFRVPLVRPRASRSPGLLWEAPRRAACPARSAAHPEAARSRPKRTRFASSL